MPRTDYETRRAERLARMRAYAERKREEARAAREAGRAIANAIPMGQPVLVGHHSEGKHRRMLDAQIRHLHKVVAATTEADRIEKRIAAAESGAAISADDPHAVERYRAKAAELEASIAAMKAANKWIRATNLMTDAEIVEKIAEQGHAMPVDVLAEARRPRFGRPGFNTTNTAAELRRVRARVAELEAEAAREPTPPLTIGRATLEECPEDNRMRLRFPERLTEAECAILRRYGFVYSPSAGAWQRKLNANARASARLAAEQLAKLSQP